MLARKARTERKQEILHEEGLRWKEDVPNFTLRGYSGGKDKTRTTGDPKRVAACCQRSEIAANSVIASLNLENLVADRVSVIRGIRATAARVAVRLLSSYTLEGVQRLISGFLLGLSTSRSALGNTSV